MGEVEVEQGQIRVDRRSGGIKLGGLVTSYTPSGGKIYSPGYQYGYQKGYRSC